MIRIEIMTSPLHRSDFTWALAGFAAAAVAAIGLACYRLPAYLSYLDALAV